jgi:branched-chain amino acid transport system permease protein
MLIDPYIEQILVTIGIGVILAQGLTVITGLAGQLSLGHAAFMSIGAFCGALLTIRAGMPFPLALAGAGTCAALAAVVIGWPILRLSGDYLAICTLGFAEIVKAVFLNLDLTNRAFGLSVPPPQSAIPLPLLVLVMALLATLAAQSIRCSRFGRALMAIRDDETAAAASGIDVPRHKIRAFAASAFLAGIGGCLYAHQLGYINPSDFGFLKSVDMLAMVVLGGLGSVPGAVLGAVILGAAPELLRFMATYRMLVYGAMLVALMVFRPHGLLGGINLWNFALRVIGRTPSRHGSTP